MKLLTIKDIKHNLLNILNLQSKEKYRPLIYYINLYNIIYNIIYYYKLILYIN